MKEPLFTGVGTALVTPMTRDGLDLPALDRLIEAQIAGGVSALIACGTTGEPSTLSEDEWAAVIDRTVRRADGRVPVIAGTGGNHTEAVIRHAELAARLGAQAQLCVTPYYNKTTQEGLFQHYLRIAEESPLPVILYNVPSRTGMTLETATAARLAEHPRIIALKEAGGDIGKVADIRNVCADALPLYCGADEMTVPMLSLGACGVISVLSNIAPRYVSDMTKAWALGDAARAAALQIKAMPLIRLLFSEVSPIPVKAAMAMMGLCENILRLPLTTMSAEKESKLRAEMKRMGLIKQ